MRLYLEVCFCRVWNSVKCIVALARLDAKQVANRRKTRDQSVVALHPVWAHVLREGDQSKRSFLCIYKCITLLQ